MDERHQRHLAELEIDLRILWVWQEIDLQLDADLLDKDNVGLIATIARWCYAKGYYDARREEKGTLERKTGYRLDID